jgi:hypothetical protein
METKITRNLLLVVNVEQIIEELKKEISLQNPESRIDIITKKPEEVMPGFEEIIRELGKSSIPLERKELEIKFFPTLQPYCLKCKVEMK